MRAGQEAQQCHNPAQLPLQDEDRQQLRARGAAAEHTSPAGRAREVLGQLNQNKQGVKLAPGAAQRAVHTAGSVPACFGSLLQPEAVSAELNLSQMPAIAEKCPKTTACSAKSLGATDVNKKLLSHDRRGRVLKPKALPLCVPAGHGEQPGTAPAGQQHGATRDTAAHIPHLSLIHI